MPGPWHKLEDGTGYARQRADGGYLRVWSVHYGRSLKVWKYSVVDARGRVEESGGIHTMKAARGAAERHAGLDEQEADGGTEMTALPRLFREVFGQRIFNIWIAMDRPPIVNVALDGPVTPPLLDGPTCGETVMVVHIRCRNERGVLDYEAANPAIQGIIEAWSEQWKDKTADDFKMPAWSGAPMRWAREGAGTTNKCPSCANGGLPRRLRQANSNAPGVEAPNYVCADCHPDQRETGRRM